MNPTVAPTPIQYQFASVKNSRLFKTWIPSGSVEFPGICDFKNNFRYQFIIESQGCKYNKGPVEETLHDSSYVQGTHSLLLRSAHTSMVKASNPISTTFLFALRR